MALITLTQPQASTWDALRGVNVEPMVFADWDIKALASGAAIADVIESPVIDLNATAPGTNLLVVHKQMAVAAADSVQLLVSPNGIQWYPAALFNGGTTGGLATSTANAADVAIVGLPSMRFVKARIALAAAMSGQASARLALSLMRE